MSSEEENNFNLNKNKEEEEENKEEEEEMEENNNIFKNNNWLLDNLFDSQRKERKEELLFQQFNNINSNNLSFSLTSSLSHSNSNSLLYQPEESQEQQQEQEKLINQQYLQLQLEKQQQFQLQFDYDKNYEDNSSIIYERSIGFNEITLNDYSEVDSSLHLSDRLSPHDNCSVDDNCSPPTTPTHEKVGWIYPPKTNNDNNDNNNNCNDNNSLNVLNLSPESSSNEVFLQQIQSQALPNRTLFTLSPNKNEQSPILPNDQQLNSLNSPDISFGFNHNNNYNQNYSQNQNHKGIAFQFPISLSPCTFSSQISPFDSPHNSSSNDTSFVYNSSLPLLQLQSQPQLQPPLLQLPHSTLSFPLQPSQNSYSLNSSLSSSSSSLSSLLSNSVLNSYSQSLLLPPMTPLPTKKNQSSSLLLSSTSSSSLTLLPLHLFPSISWLESENVSIFQRENINQTIEYALHLPFNLLIQFFDDEAPEIILQNIIQKCSTPIEITLQQDNLNENLEYFLIISSETIPIQSLIYFVLEIISERFNYVLHKNNQIINKNVNKINIINNQNNQNSYNHDSHIDDEYSLHLLDTAESLLSLTPHQSKNQSNFNS